MQDKNLTPRPGGETKPHDTRWMSLIFGPDAPMREPLDKMEDKKIELFEKGLAREIGSNDSIDQAFTKIVRMALAAEFGPSFVRSAGSKTLVDTITRGIMGDSDLRRQALLIIDRFSKTDKS